MMPSFHIAKSAGLLLAKAIASLRSRVLFGTLVGVPVGVFLVGGLAATTTAIAQGRAATVFVELVDKREIRDTQTVIGQLVGERRASVATRIPGIIDSVDFRVGDRVRKDQPLARIDASRIAIDQNSANAAIAVAKAGIAVADARLKIAEQNFKRQASLRRSAAFSLSRYEDLQLEMVRARNERAQAEAQLQVAKAGGRLAEYQLQHTVIKAPFDGVIIARRAQPGQYIVQGGTIAVLLDVTNLEVEAAVPSNIANGLERGMRIAALFDGGTRKDVILRSLIPVQNVSTRTRPVRFTAKIKNLQRAHIAIGSTVTLQMPVSAARQVVAAPKDALIQGGSGWMVFVANNNKAERRTVTIGSAVGDRMEITSGLAAGDKVVVRGNERLRPGQPINARLVTEPNSAPKGPAAKTPEKQPAKRPAKQAEKQQG